MATPEPQVADAGERADDIESTLVRRLGAEHARLRLGIERRDEERRGLGGQTWMHVESWPGGDHLIRLLFRLSGLYGRAHANARKPQRVENTLRLPHLPDALEGLTILQLSDLHLDMAPDIPLAIGNAVRGLNYDLCVLTGDYRGATYGDWGPAVDALAGLRKQLRGPVYGILGNHDSVQMLPAIEAMGITMLMNEHVLIERGDDRLYLAGVDDPHYFGTDDVEAAARHIPANAPSVLLAHSPELYARAAAAGFDVMLCGHTHGGQICLPGQIPVISNARAPRRVCVGAWQERAMLGYTSRGAGVSVVDLRLNCPPEVTLHTLRRA